MRSKMRVEFVIFVLLLSPLFLALIPDFLEQIRRFSSFYPSIGYPVSESEFAVSVNILRQEAYKVLIGWQVYQGLQLYASYRLIKIAGVPELTKFAVIALCLLYINDVKSIYILTSLIDNSSINILINNDFERVRDAVEVHNFIILITFFCLAGSMFLTGNQKFAVVLIIIAGVSYSLSAFWPAQVMCYRWVSDPIVVLLVQASWILQGKRNR